MENSERRGKRPRSNGKVFYHEHSPYKGKSTESKGKTFTTKDVEKYFIYLWGKKFKEISRDEYLTYKKVGAHVEIETA